MSIFLKINPRMKLVSHNEESFIFSIDENRTATFYMQTQDLYKTLLAFVYEGKSLDKLKNQDQCNKSSSRLLLFIENLKKNGFIDYHFHFSDSDSVIVYPKSHSFKDSYLTSTSLVSEQCPYTLSRFAYFRREDDKIALECPLAPFKAILTKAVFIQLLPFITGEKNLTDHKYIFSQDAKTRGIFFNLLVGHEILYPIHEQEVECLKFWEFHDLVFHSRSRRGEFDDNLYFGATYRFHKELNPPLTFKQVDLDKTIELYKPNLNELLITDPTFSKVLESRRSLRNFNENKMLNINELGEFLYRSIAIRKVVKTPLQDAIFRPYPAAGAIHEIEFYLVVNACDGLEPDIYYYQPMKHILCRRNVDKQYVEKIISNTKAGMGINATSPQIVFVLTSRFGKIAWKYEKMAYRCTLISMGAIFQTMSLVATSMNLASCIVGSGDSSLFAEALEINLLEEGAVGEFALGVQSDAKE